MFRVGQISLFEGPLASFGEGGKYIDLFVAALRNYIIHVLHITHIRTTINEKPSDKKTTNSMNFNILNTFNILSFFHLSLIYPLVKQYCVYIRASTHFVTTEGIW